MTADRWYREGLRFACTHCGHCCTTAGYVWVTRREAQRIAAHLELTLDGFGRRFLRTVGRRLALTDRSDGACVFWDQGCTIYAVRPGQCRTFPFWQENVADVEAWEETAECCEGIGAGRLYRIGEIEQLVGGRGATAEVGPPDAGADRGETGD